MNRDSFENGFQLDGKIAVVTGGAGILGRRFCAGLASFGAEIAILDLSADAAEEAASAITGEFGVRAAAVPCDVADKGSVETAVAKVCREFGGIDILMNNAASKSDDLEAFFAPFEDYSLDTWRQVMSVNIDGMFLMAQAVGRRMIERGAGGSIIQTASIYGAVGPDQRIYEGSEYMGRKINTPAVYSTSKAAVIGLTRHLATYWADRGIRVNALTPGGVASGQNEEFASRYAARVPLGRMAARDEMVGAAVFLASDLASYVTGHNLVVDGGWSVW